MNAKEYKEWQKANDTYLAVSLEWLRLRSIRLISKEATPTSSRSGQIHEEQKLEARNIDEKIANAAKAIIDAGNIQPPPALITLGHKLNLSPFEQALLLLCTAMEIDTGMARLCALAQQSDKTYPTFALAFALFDNPEWSVLSPKQPLRYWRLIEINQPGAEPLTTSALGADERIVNYIKGLNYLDDRVDPLLVPFDGEIGKAELAPSQKKAVDNIISQIKSINSSQRYPVIQLLGTDGFSKQAVAWQVASDNGLNFYRMPVEMLPTQFAELETFSRLLQREGLLIPLALYFETSGLDMTPANTQMAALRRLINNSFGIFFLSVIEPLSGLGRQSFTIQIDRPTSVEQNTVWKTVLGKRAGNNPSRLAGQFNLNLANIQQITRSVPEQKNRNEKDLEKQLWNACVIKTLPKLDKLARLLDPRATWEDIVLPDEPMGLLNQIADQVRHRIKVYNEWGFHQKMSRGLGISALFSGVSGTGKTMAAEVIAKELGLKLCQIDLSAVVSKYIGETEKNLRKLFDAAEEGGAILFFDEADALFGKRSEVRDSHDRYANIEINYLLQRMEAFSGLAILATNMKNNLDQGFMRRLRFIVNFPFPKTEDRRRIWQKVFPSQTPTNGLDYERLARLNLTGGSIHNIALNASFLAAKAEQPVTMPIVLAAAQDELRKLERPLRRADFIWKEPQEALNHELLSTTIGGEG